MWWLVGLIALARSQECWRSNIGMFPDSAILSQREYVSDAACIDWCKELPDCQAGVSSPVHWAYRECFLVSTSEVTTRIGWAAALKSCFGGRDWTAVIRDLEIDFDLQQNPLQIRTNSAAGSYDKIDLWFYDKRGATAGGLSILFRNKMDTMQYWINFCTGSYFRFPTAPPAEQDKVWTILRTDIGLKVECNGVLVLHYNISQCRSHYSSTKYKWESDVKKIKFTNEDTASDVYLAPDRKETKDNTLAHWQIGLIAGTLFLVAIVVVRLLSTRGRYCGRERCVVVQTDAVGGEDTPVPRTPEPTHTPRAARTFVKESSIPAYNDCVGETQPDVAPPSYQEVQERADLYVTPAAAGL